jgi:hypothetical protein
MKQRKAKNLTTVSRKFIGVPVTNLEKFDRLNIKNPVIERLRDIFSLDVEL